MDPSTDHDQGVSALIDQEGPGSQDPACAAGPDSAAGPGGLAALAGLLAAAAGEDAAWAARITPDTRLEADLGIDSVEFAELDLALREQCGGVDLAAFLATLDIDEIIGLTVGALLAHLESHTHTEPQNRGQDQRRGQIQDQARERTPAPAAGPEGRS